MALFVAIEVAEALATDPEAAAKLAEVCPVDIFDATPQGLQVVDANVDECTLCELCLHVGEPGQVTVRKLYEDGAALERSA